MRSAPDGRDGLWFLTLAVDSVTTAIAARSALSVPGPAGEVLVHMSPGVTARLGWPERASTRP
jgi:hypothetical protein